MHDHIAGIDQYPVALPHALDTNARTARIFDVFDEVIGNSTDMALRPAAGHDHVIADRGFSGEIDDDAVLGFHVFKTRKDGAERLLGTRVPGDGFGRTTRCPRECRGMQGFGSFLFLCVALTPVRTGDFKEHNYLVRFFLPRRLPVLAVNFRFGVFVPRFLLLVFAPLDLRRERSGFPSCLRRARSAVEDNGDLRP
jgi:hypothetical protein